MRYQFRVKRVYETPTEEDGIRVLVDRLWPRGVTKEAAQIDHWAKVLTPSNELRKWFHADRTQFDEFAAKYLAELEGRYDEISAFCQALDGPNVTLITSTKSLEQGHVAVLMKFLESNFDDIRVEFP